MSIYEKLLNIQTELKAPKSQRNNFGKYNYRSCEDILEAVKPLLKKEKCTLIINDEIERLEARYYIKARYYVKATVDLIDIETGEKISTNAYAREEESKKGMDGSQVTGASSSYARKYALNGLFAIDDTKDSDTTNQHDKKQNAPNQHDKKQNAPNQQSIIKQQIAEILKVKEISFDKVTEVINARFKKQKFDELTANEQQKLLEEVRAW